jgi:hypothetical protein
VQIDADSRRLDGTTDGTSAPWAAPGMTLRRFYEVVDVGATDAKDTVSRQLDDRGPGKDDGHAVTASLCANSRVRGTAARQLRNGRKRNERRFQLQIHDSRRSTSPRASDQIASIG